jgi:serine/threonine protein kinase
MLSTRSEFWHQSSKFEIAPNRGRDDSIVGYKEAFFEDDTSQLCLVMEYLDDGDLY